MTVIARTPKADEAIPFQESSTDRDCFASLTMTSPRERCRRLIGLFLLLLLALPGCRDDEQGRSIHLHKGSYAGPPVPPLSDAQIARLQQRAMHENE
jgi:hypothetical protein